jgi:hypothetical protein
LLAATPERGVVSPKQQLPTGPPPLPRPSSPRPLSPRPLRQQGPPCVLYVKAPDTAPLTTQVYNGAERFPFEPDGQPGLSVSGDGRGCNELTGRFEIHRLTFVSNRLTDFVATWEQFCENSPSYVLRGCVRSTP